MMKMKKTIITVFVLIGVLLICALVWDMVFNDGGIISSVWNAIATPVNNAWKAIAPNGNDLIPEWGNNIDHGGAENGAGW